MKVCSNCNEPPDCPVEAWEDGRGGILCQACWEAACSDSWWEMVKDLEPTGYPDEYRRVTT